jgi:TldD protein
VVDDGSISGAARFALDRRRRHANAGETVLIEDGILKGYMQDRLNARLMGVAPTGQWPARKLRPCPDAAHDQHLS